MDVGRSFCVRERPISGEVEDFARPLEEGKVTSCAVLRTIDPMDRAFEGSHTYLRA